jgi:hypothetical protein
MCSGMRISRKAIFNSGASLGVQGRLTNPSGTNITPICTQNGNGGGTGETNTFNLAHACLTPVAAGATIMVNSRERLARNPTPPIRRLPIMSYDRRDAAT